MEILTQDNKVYDTNIKSKRPLIRIWGINEVETKKTPKLLSEDLYHKEQVIEHPSTDKKNKLCTN